MAEYIEREAVVKRIEVTPLLKYGIPKKVRDGVIDLVKIQPAADVAPVVRCEDCKYSCKYGNGRICEGYWYDLSEFAVPVKDDGFCSYGEPKMDGGADNG